MQTLFIHDRQITYDGTQLAPHWIYRRFDLLGDATVAFVGPCRVDLSEMVDLTDVKAQAPIYSPLMLHVLAEFFHGDLHLTVFRQRLLIAIASEQIQALTGRHLRREGDDLYLERPDGQLGKLSVSIATASTVSTLIHTGFNIETMGTPVSTIGLAELGIDVGAFAASLLRAYTDELESIWLARCKVRGV